MGRVRRFLILGTHFLGTLLGSSQNREPPYFHFRADDPIWREPPPLSVGKPARRKIDDAYDQLEKTLFRPGKAGASGPPRAIAVNTVGEAPDSDWYVNRHGRKRMSLKELIRGPGSERAPDISQRWVIVSAKNEGVTPGFIIRDGRGRRYVMKFDAPRFPNATTSADVIGSKFFYALGYYTPENYIVRFSREQLLISPNAKITDPPWPQTPHD